LAVVGQVVSERRHVGGLILRKPACGAGEEYGVLLSFSQETIMKILLAVDGSDYTRRMISVATKVLAKCAVPVLLVR
jgi:hypothetical protein